VNNPKPWDYKVKKRWGFWERFWIGVPDNVYMERLSIIWTPWFSIKLHKIFRADRQEDLHDHPWSFFSIILHGSYVENTPDGLKKRTIWNWKRATDRHSIREVSRSPVWSLVFCGPKIRSWGFWVDDGMGHLEWIKWREYENLYGA